MSWTKMFSFLLSTLLGSHRSPKLTLTLNPNPNPNPHSIHKPNPNPMKIQTIRTSVWLLIINERRNKLIALFWEVKDGWGGPNFTTDFAAEQTIIIKHRTKFQPSYSKN